MTDHANKPNTEIFVKRLIECQLALENLCETFLDLHYQEGISVVDKIPIEELPNLLSAYMDGYHTSYKKRMPAK